MSFPGGDAKGKKAVEDVGAQTQVLDSDDDHPLPSGDDHGDVHFEDTIPLDDNYVFETVLMEEGGDLDDETQVMEDPNCIVHEFEGETQLLEDMDCARDESEKDFVVNSDTEGTENTEVLLSDADGVSDDETTTCEVDEFNGEREIRDGVKESEKEPHIPSPCSHDQGGKDFAVDSDASTDEDCSSAGHHISSGSPNVNATGSNPGMPVLRVHAAEKSHRIRARKLFNEQAPGSEETTKKVDGPIETTDSSQLLVTSHVIAGLSYVGSQEPGEQSQANALNIVDKFLSINDVELSGEVHPTEDPGGKSPHASGAKGAQSLAKRSDLKSLVGRKGIFDWIDSCEDEGGGDFFSKRKDVLLESRRNIQKSHTQPRKRMNVDFKRTGDVVDKFREKDEGITTGIGQKIIGLTHSDSKLVLHSSLGGDRIQLFGVKAKKNLLKELDGQSNAEVSRKQLEETAIEGSSHDVYDVGIDTQLAAEAMEELVCGPPADHGFTKVHPVARNLIESSSRGARKNKACSKHVSIRKKSCSTSDSEKPTRKSKQTKRTKLSRQRPNSSGKHSKDLKMTSTGKESAMKVNSKREKWESEEGHFATWASLNVNECSGKKSSKSINRGKFDVDVGVTHLKEVDSVAPNEHALVDQGIVWGHLHGITAPIASRTRQSKTVNQLKRTEILSSCFVVEDSILGNKRMGSNPMNYPKGRRTRRRISDDLNNASNLNGLSIATEEVAKVSARSFISKTRSKIDAGKPSVSVDTVKTRSKTRLADAPMSRSLPMDIPPKPRDSPPCLAVNGTTNEDVFPNGPCMPSETDRMASSTGMTEKVPSENSTSLTSVPLRVSGHRYGIEPSRTIVEDAEGNAALEGTPKGKVQLSHSACSTPSKDTFAVSPICEGDARQKQSSKKGLSRSSLSRELSRLDALEAARIPVLKDMRRRRDMATVRVLFSHHLGEDIIKQQKKKILARLGVSIASSSWDATHFIADKFVRTRNMLEAMALGKPVVTHLWLESCGQASCFIDERNYLLRDTKKEKEISFNMPASLARACHSPLLQGKRVFITPNVKPSRELIASLVKAVHGQAMERIVRLTMKDDKILDDLLIISCEDDYPACVPLLEKGAEVYSSELLLNGIVIQKLEYKRHQLFLDHVKRTRSTIWLRNESDNQFTPISRHS